MESSTRKDFPMLTVGILPTQTIDTALQLEDVAQVQLEDIIHFETQPQAEAEAEEFDYIPLGARLSHFPAAWGRASRWVRSVV